MDRQQIAGHCLGRLMASSLALKLMQQCCPLSVSSAKLLAAARELTETMLSRQNRFFPDSTKALVGPAADWWQSSADKPEAVGGCERWGRRCKRCRPGQAWNGRAAAIPRGEPELTVLHSRFPGGEAADLHIPGDQRRHADPRPAAGDSGGGPSNTQGGRWK